MIFSKEKRKIHNIYISHTLRSVFLSFVSVYVPIFLLSKNFTLSKLAIFYIIFDLSGLLFVFFVLIPAINKFSLLKVLKWHYPLQILFYILLFAMVPYSIPFYLVAMVGGFATFVYWIPLNILLVKYSKKENMGSDLAWFFSLPKFFNIISPLISAFLITFFNFYIIFIIASLGLIISYLPLIGVDLKNLKINIKFKNIFLKIKERKRLLFLEVFDNILDKSERFWAIFVYLMIGTIAAPGIVGSLESLGGALFTLFVGKYANKHSYKLIILSSLSLSLIWFLRMFIKTPFWAYSISIFASFAITMFVVSYVTFIYKKIKNKKEEEFLILREIPTVLGRLILFGVILIFVNNLQMVFFLPIITLIILIITLRVFQKS